MISELKKKEGDNKFDIVDQVIDQFRIHPFVKLTDTRRRFVNSLYEDIGSRDAFGNCIKVMANKYIALFQQNAKGKQFGRFNQSWFDHINDYFIEPESNTECYDAWRKVMESSIHSTCTVEEQRIIVSTVAYMVYDAMTGRVKEYKIDLQADIADHKELSNNDDGNIGKVKSLVESNVSLYRYGRWAIHSLLQKYTERKDTCSESISTVLRCMVMKSEESGLLPTAIHLLHQGGLTILSPKMLP